MPLDPDAIADMLVQTVETALGPILERLSGVDATLARLGDLRDRCVALETKAAIPIAPDPAVIARLATIEAQQDHLARVEAALGDLTKEAVTLRERIAVAEVRALVPGPAGKDGTDGVHGTDGADGVGFDDLVLEQPDERSLTLKAVRGDHVKAIGTVRFPVQIQRGVYQDGKAYEPGDIVTWGGSTWHCSEPTTTKPGEYAGAKAWTLCVKKGRDGRDGKDGRDLVPVVAAGRRD